VEWVETTGKTVDEAMEAALDQLGVLDEDAEFEILEEPKPGLFGRVRGTARVRARVAPSAPPPKQERRRRTGRGKNGDKNGAKSGDTAGGRAGDTAGGTDGGSSAKGSGGSGSRSAGSRGTAGAESSAASGGSAGRSTEDTRPKAPKEREMMPESEQREAGEEFLRGLLEAVGYEASVSSALDEEGVLSFDVQGDQLGLLIGPGLHTLDAVQEVCRNAIQRQADGREYGKVTLDISGARADRTASLEAFVREEAQRVLDSGEDVIFEVMSRGDRKIVHDVVGEFDGLATESVGEDPRRRVVLRLA
jgi:spoIIIJ-associated protein